MNIRDKISYLIKNLRKKRKMTVEELARKSGVAKATIYRIENGNLISRVDTLDMLFKALGYKFFIGGTNNAKG